MSNLSNILVTEDDAVLNNLMQKVLQREGFDTEGALSGAEAIDKFSNGRDSLLLIDYGLPDMTGEDVIAALSEKSTSSSIPFVLVTGMGNESIAVDMMKRGAMDYIIKDDVFIEELPVKVRSVLAALDQEKDIEEEEVLLQTKSYFNQVLLDSMPYIAIILNPVTKEIIASNRAAEQIRVVSGVNCLITSGGNMCPWCTPPDSLEKGAESDSVIEDAGKLWNAKWMAIDDNMYMVFAVDITDYKHMFKKGKSQKKALKDLSTVADGIDSNLSGLKDNLNKLANSLLQIKDRSE